MFGPNSGFSTKEGFKIRNPWISWYPFGTENHEMWGPPVNGYFKKPVEINRGSVYNVEFSNFSLVSNPYCKLANSTLKNLQLNGKNSIQDD